MLFQIFADGIDLVGVVFSKEKNIVGFNVEFIFRMGFFISVDTLGNTAGILGRHGNKADIFAALVEQ